MQRRACLLLRMLEPEVLSHSPRLLCNSAAYILVQLQIKLLGVPEEHIVAITLTSPHRLLSTVVQLPQNMIDDGLPKCSKMGVSEIEDFTDANRIGAFGNGHLADLIGKVFLVMMRLFRRYLPADVVEQEHKEFTVAKGLSS